MTTTMSDFLAVPSTTAATANKSDDDAQSLLSTPGTASLDGFDFKLDNDSFGFLMGSSGSDHSGDSSAEDSYMGASTPPSSIGSPSNPAMAPPGGMKQDDPAFAFLTPQAFEDGLDMSSFGFGDDLSGMANSFMDPLGFPNDPLAVNPASAYFMAPDNRPPYMFDFSRAAASIPTGQPPIQRPSPFLQAPRRMSDASSVTSGSSRSMGGSASPMLPANAMSSQPPSFAALPQGIPLSSGNPMIDELTQKARQAVGVSMALPGGAQAALDHPKVPIPRLQQSGGATPPSQDKQTSSSSSATPSMIPSMPPSATPSVPVPRTKTAHTTIERRYRTNINTRIQDLRAAVPALRVLEQKDGNRIGNLNIRGDSVDVVDERGYVDGVKVARKGSKANVLGKAAEYIHVLKRRELRLVREKEGLRSLITSLVGGPALLREWEDQWASRFGGPEKDEVDPSELADDEDEEDEDGDDNEEGAASKKRKRSTGDALPKARKEPKSSAVSSTASSSTTSVSGPPGQPEKRKRGRPRKVPVPPSSPSDSFQGPMPTQVPNIMVSSTLDPNFSLNDILAQAQYATAGDVQMADRQPQPQHVQPGQYLLAAFAFFSFFNSPITMYTSRTRPEGHATHSGVVLDTHNSYAGEKWAGQASLSTSPIGLHEVVQFFHLIVCFLLFVSIVGPWLPRVHQRRVARVIPSLLRPLLNLPHGQPTSTRKVEDSDGRSSSSEDSEDEREDAHARSTLSTALRSRGLNVKEEMQLLRAALGLEPGAFGLLSSVLHFLTSARKPSAHRLETRMMEQKAFQRLAELVALDVDASFAMRIQTYIYAFKFISTSSASISDLATLALVVRPVWPTKALALWELAVNRAAIETPSLRRAKPYEALALDDMSVEDAIERCRKVDHTALPSHTVVSAASSDNDSDVDSEDDMSLRDSVSGPLAVLAKQIVLDFIRERTEQTFVHAIVDEAEAQGIDAGQDDARCHQIVAAGKSLDRRTADLVRLFERTCLENCALPSSLLADSDESGSEDDEVEETALLNDESDIRTLLRVILLYRQLYPSTLLKVQQPASSGPHTPQPTSKPPISISLTPMPSPPPSPSPDSAHDDPVVNQTRLRLRRALASPAFDRSDLLEDARDSVVDLLEHEAKRHS